MREAERIEPLRATSNGAPSLEREKNAHDLSPHAPDPEATMASSPGGLDELPPRLSIPRVALLCTAMLMTYFLGVRVISFCF